MAKSWGTIRWRPDGGVRRPFLDFRPFGRVYSMPGGVPLRTKAEADYLLRDIRSAFAHGTLTKESTLARYQSSTNPRMTVRAKYRVFLDFQAGRVEAGDIGFGYYDELVRYGKAGGYYETIGSKRIDLVTTGDLADLDQVLAARGLSPKTRHHALSVLRTFYGWLADRDEIERVPRFPRVRVVREIRPTLTSAQQRTVVDAIPETKRGAFLALAYHGLRPSECARLDVVDYDFRSGVISIRAAKAKSKEAAQIEASEELRQWLAKYVRPAWRLTGAPLFRNPIGRQLGKRWLLESLEHVWNAAEIRAGVPHVGLYAGTKHTSGTEALRRGVGLASIQAAFRHASSRSTELYAQAARMTQIEVLRGPGVSLDSEGGENRG